MSLFFRINEWLWKHGLPAIFPERCILCNRLKIPLYHYWDALICNKCDEKMSKEALNEVIAIAKEYLGLLLRCRSSKTEVEKT